MGVYATTLEANAAMRSTVIRDTEACDQECLAGLAKELGIETPTREPATQLDWTRKKRISNEDWEHPHDPDARIADMKAGSTHLAHKAENTVDLEAGAIMAVTVQGADERDMATMIETLARAGKWIVETAAVKTEADGERVNAGGRRRWLRTRAISAMRRCGSSVRAVCGVTVRNRIGDGGSGRGRRLSRRRFMGTGGGCGEVMASG